ncbi:MAG: hypothetical protein K2Y32_18840 [Candidatus Obscuribacterales bacterium]|nr:hypothetical protein [Candidatus Obscuribacterales bacterium]
MRFIKTVLFLTLPIVWFCSNSGPIGLMFLWLRLDQTFFHLPPPDKFHFFLKRDLELHFSSEVQSARVEYEQLNIVPSQVGVGWPKYFLWVRVFSRNKLVNEGAAKVAAISKEQFFVEDFYSKEQLMKSPLSLRHNFAYNYVAEVFNRAGIEKKRAEAALAVMRQDLQDQEKGE